MRNLLAFMMALLLTVGALGWYLDWFRIGTTPGKDGHTTLNIDFNSTKALQDTAKAGTRLTEMAEKKAKETEAQLEAEKKTATQTNTTDTKVQPPARPPY